MTPIQLKKLELKRKGIVSGEAGTPELKGRADSTFQVFNNYTIIHQGTLGTFYIPSDIYRIYEQDGGINKNPLGFPICDVLIDEENGTKTSEFELGKIISNSKGDINSILNDAVTFKRTHVSVKVTKSHKEEKGDFM